MTAYPKSKLHHLAIQLQVGNAVDVGLLAEKRNEIIAQAYPTGLYTPNIFIRIGLGILTFFVLSAFSGLVGLITGMESATGIVLFLLLCSYAALEVMAKKGHYNSGVDNVLLASILLLVALLAILLFPNTTHSAQYISMAVFVAACCLTLRFTDQIMAIVAVAAFLAWLSFVLTSSRFFPVNLVGMAGMMASGIFYFLVVRLYKSANARLYQQVLSAAKVLLLLAFYFFGNRYVVQFVLTGNMPGLNALPMVWWLNIFWWMCTVVIPVGYLLAGIKKRDVVLIRLGILLFILSAVTIRYYYHIAPLEIALLIAGIVLIILSYAFIQYLQQPRFGWCSKQMRRSGTDALNVEGLVISEVFGKQQSETTSQTKFGGGTFGGAGAGSDY